MSLPRYPEYKDSGVEWLGEVPEHWEVKRLKRNLQLLTEKTERREHPVALENIESWSGRFVETETEFQGEGVAFEPGDILFGKLRPYLAKAYLADTAGEAVGDFHVMRPSTDIDGRFTQYQILNRDFITIVDSSTFGAKMPRASWDFLCNMELATPPKIEQQAIAAFLDRETGKIDALIAEQRRLVELLAEKRQAVISHAVTKGISQLRHSGAVIPAQAGIQQEKKVPRSGQSRGPAAQEFSNQLDSGLRRNDGVAMKDSGIAWLGEVPEHWQVLSIRRIATSVQTGGTPSSQPPSLDLDKGFVWYTPGDFGASIFLGDSSRKITNAVAESGEANIFPAGSVLIVSIGATLGKVGYIDKPSSANQQINAIVPNEKVNGYFLAYSLLIKSEVMRFLSNASTIGIMNQEKTKDIWLAVPPLSEQQTIAAFLDTETAKFDTLTAEANRAIALLQERRSALISAAVTGKIDVRGVVIPARHPVLRHGAVSS